MIQIAIFIVAFALCVCIGEVIIKLINKNK